MSQSLSLLLLYVLFLGIVVARKPKTIPYKFSSSNNYSSVPALRRLLTIKGVKEPDRIIRYLPYELGDCFRHHGAKKKLLEVCNKWEDSIACEYVRRTTQANNIDVLIDIIKRRATSTDRPPPDTTIIHARLGDVIIRSNCHIERCQIGGNRIYSYTLAEYDTVIDTIPTTNKIEIVAFPFHVPNIVGVNVTNELSTEALVLIEGAYNRSLSYRDELFKYFQSRFGRVSIRDYHTPDEDFIYLCQAKSIIVGGGNFGSTVGRIVSDMGGRVINIRNSLWF